jgi:RNA polymerase sigma-70 factor (ECF subfamily)
MDAVRQLFEAEIPGLRRYARALTHSSDHADDLVHETILRGLEKLHLYQPGTNLRAWLFTLMHNQYVNSIRRSMRRGEEIALETVTLAVRPSQTERLTLRDLERAIAALPDEQRATLLLVGLAGMKYEEVAQICDVPMGTVRSRLSRGREVLRQMLEGDGSISNRAEHAAGPLRRHDPIRRDLVDSAMDTPAHVLRAAIDAETGCSTAAIVPLHKTRARPATVCKWDKT